MDLKKIVAPLALCLALMMVMVPNTSAYSALGTHVDLYDNNVDVANETTDYQFYVGIPDYFSLDADYWNFTVYGVLVNATGAAADTTFVVYVYINDGTTNVTANSGNMALVNSSTARVYGNISIAAASITTLTAVDNATFTVLLKVSSTVKDSYVGTVEISETYMGGIISWMIPTMFSLFAVVLVLGFMTKILGQMPKMAKGKGKK